MTYAETIEYLYARLPMFSRAGAVAIKPDLVNTEAICEWLGRPEKKFRTIHIAGTNGKGSCSHMLAAVLQECGYRTGLYTSPHLRDFRERIRIDGNMINEEEVVRFTGNVIPLIDRLHPSFFEITVGMAFDWFANQHVDIAVIETGLGGRLDSTNVITPVLSVITNIGMDHMNLLGNSLQEIAAEKAGIIKNNVPVVIGESSRETDNVFLSMATFRSAPIHFADKIRYSADWKQEHGHLEADVVDASEGSRKRYRLDLPGYYQLKNLVTVVEALHQLRELGYDLPHARVTHALARVKKLTGLHGRWETIHRNPEIVLDVAHNEDGVKAMLRQLELTTYSSLHIVIGMVKDKEYDKVLSIMPGEARYYFTQASIPRALPAAELAASGNALGLQGESFNNVNDAIKAAMARASAGDIILVCGSVFIVGEVLPVHT